MPAAPTRTRTSPARGGASSTSSTRRRWPGSYRTAAFMPVIIWAPAGANPARSADVRQPVAQHRDLVRQCDVRIFDLRVPALLPFGDQPALIAAAPQHVETVADRDLAIAEQDQLPALAIRRLARVLDVDAEDSRTDQVPDLLGRLTHTVGVQHVPDDAHLRAAHPVQHPCDRGRR